MQARLRLIRILEVVTSRELVAPSDVVVETGLPRYTVLAYIQCLEALGVVEPVYVKGSHKLYTATPAAEKLLKALREGVKRPIEALLGVEAVASSSSAGAAAQVEA